MNDMALIKWTNSLKGYICCGVFKNFAYNRATYQQLVNIIQPTGKAGESKYIFVELNGIANISPTYMTIIDRNWKQMYNVGLSHEIYRQIEKLRLGI